MWPLCSACSGSEHLKYARMLHAYSVKWTVNITNSLINTFATKNNTLLCVDKGNTGLSCNPYGHVGPHHAPEWMEEAVSCPCLFWDRRSAASGATELVLLSDSQPEGSRPPLRGLNRLGFVCPQWAGVIVPGVSISMSTKLSLPTPSC